MKSTLNADLRRLAAMPFPRGERGAGLVRRIDRLHRRARAQPDSPAIEGLYPWLFVPLTFWPVDLEEPGRHVVDQLRSGHRLDPPVALLLSLLGKPPDETATAVTLHHEHAVWPGGYGSLTLMAQMGCRPPTDRSKLRRLLKLIPNPYQTIKP